MGETLLSVELDASELDAIEREIDRSIDVAFGRIVFTTSRLGGPWGIVAGIALQGAWWLGGGAKGFRGLVGQGASALDQTIQQNQSEYAKKYRSARDYVARHSMVDRDSETGAARFGVRFKSDRNRDLSVKSGGHIGRLAGRASSRFAASSRLSQMKTKKLDRLKALRAQRQRERKIRNTPKN
jgi:hypothetical protein